MKKRLFFILTVSILLCAALTLTAFSEPVNSGSCGDGVSWAIDEPGVLTISGEGAMDDFDAPEDAPYYDEDVYEVVVEEGVTAVGKNAFGGMYLDNVHLPVSLTSIGQNAFANTAVAEAHFSGSIKQWTENVTIASGNTNLTQCIVMDQSVSYDGNGLHLSNGVLTIDHKRNGASYVVTDSFREEYNTYVFAVVFAEGTTTISEQSAHDLTYAASLTIPESVTAIGNQAFSRCSSLEEVVIPGNVASIGNSAFYYCTSLQKVTIPESVTEIDHSAFFANVSLSEVHISSIDAWCRISFGENSMTGFSSNPLVYAHNLYVNGNRITNLIIPDTVTSICDHAFHGFSSLTSVTIPDSVTSIGKYAFYECTSLNNLTIPDSVLELGEWVFAQCTALSNLTIGNGITNLTSRAFSNCTALRSVIIPDSVITLGVAPFGECPNLEHVSIPNSVTTIGDGAFTECSALHDITIPDSVTSIGNSAFYRCKALTDIVLPDGITTLVEWTFAECDSLSSITIGSSVVSISEDAFLFCDALTDVYYDGTSSMWQAIDIYSSEFGSWDCGLYRAAIHYVSACGETGEDRWSILWDGTLKITGTGTMADYAEGEAPWLPYENEITAYVVKPYVKNVGTYAFAGLSNLTVLNGMEGVTAIGEGAFKNCTGLTGLAIPASVTSMGQNAFAGCTLLTSAGPIGSGAAIEYGWPKVIPANAFYGADCLETVTLPAAGTRLMANAFRNCSSLTAIELPESLTTVQNSAFAGTGLVKVTLPQSVRTLGNSAFATSTLTNIWVKNASCSIGTAANTLGDPAVTHVCADADSTALSFAATNGYTVHSFGEWVRTLVPTCAVAGEESRVCAFCGETEIHVLDALGHDYGADGICTRCGKVEPEGFLAGLTDVNSSAYYWGALSWAVNHEPQITVGTSDTTFSPKKVCSRAEIVTMLWRAMGCPEPTGENPFEDVSSDDWYYDAVRWAYENNLTDGVDETHFDPDGRCSRAQIVTFLYRAAGNPIVTSTECGFEDVPEDAWYRDAVLWAVENNITDGTSASAFSPNRLCTRAQVVTFLYRFMGD